MYQLEKMRSIQKSSCDSIKMVQRYLLSFSDICWGFDLIKKIVIIGSTDTTIFQSVLESHCFHGHV